VRSVDKGETAKADILSRLPNSVDIIKTVDLSTFAFVKAFAEDIMESVAELHVVQLCAGAMSPSFTVGC
jgi:hypothetical protein